MRSLDRMVEKIATRNHGVVTRQQLLAAGLSHPAIQRRVANGRLLREFPGVYRVGHRAPSLEARYLGAVLACGEGSALAGRAAAYLYGLIKGRAPRPEVVTPTERRIPGIRTVRSRPRRGGTFRGIPILTVPEVIVDLAASLHEDDLARACHEAGVRYRTTPRQVEAVMPPNAPGAARLHAILRGDTQVSLSEMEAEFFRLLKADDLPLPQTNKVASGRRVDARWPGLLTVELLSYTYHGSRHAWELDHRRAREAYKRGEEFRSYTYYDVCEDPTLMLAELRRLLL